MKEVDLVTLQHGAVLKMFNREMEKVLDNIDNENIKPDLPRTVTIKLTFTPDREREHAVIKIDVSSRLPSKPKEGVVFLAPKKGGRLAVMEDDWKQKELTDSNGENVFSMPQQGIAEEQ